VANIVLHAQLGVNWAVCFHAQQATEKALKAVLVLYGIDFPRSHALERLLALIPAEPASTFEVESVVELTPWAATGRYPEDIPNPDTGSSPPQRPPLTTLRLSSRSLTSHSIATPSRVLAAQRTHAPESPHRRGLAAYQPLSAVKAATESPTVPMISTLYQIPQRFNGALRIITCRKR
jgi:HEPN domain